MEYDLLTLDVWTSNGTHAITMQSTKYTTNPSNSHSSIVNKYCRLGCCVDGRMSFHLINKKIQFFGRNMKANWSREFIPHKWDSQKCHCFSSSSHSAQKRQNVLVGFVHFYWVVTAI
jgi:hypothetical protein